MEMASGELTIGRDTDRQMVLPSASVSRRHARLVLGGPQPYVVDEGSANGVLVNGVRITQPTAIAPGVRVDVADFRLEFEDLVAQQALAAQQAAVPAGGTGFTEAVRPIDDRPRNPYEEDVIRLVATGGPFDGRIYDIPMTELGVGRAVDNDLILDDPSLSRKHARIRRAGPGRIELEDLGSSNGTFVNGRRVGKGNAGAGDTVRFGDLIFRVQGARSDGTRAYAGGGGGRSVLIAVLVALLVVVAGGGVAAIFLFKKPASPVKDFDKAVEQAAAHVKSGKAKLLDKRFTEASAEFEQAIELDPTNTEARKLKVLADTEPDNETRSKQASVKATMADRSSLETAIRILDKIPSDSVFRETTAKKVSNKLVSFGEAQCKARKWLDCAWSICKAYEIAPDDAKPVADAAALLKEAEKKLAKDKSWTGCKAKR